MEETHTEVERCKMCGNYKCHIYSPWVGRETFKNYQDLIFRSGHIYSSSDSDHEMGMLYLSCLHITNFVPGPGGVCLHRCLST